jgi:hypothetical protein
MYHHSMHVTQRDRLMLAGKLELADKPTAAP